MKTTTSLSLVLLAVVSSIAVGFSPCSVISSSSSSTRSNTNKCRLYMTKRYPSGRPFTGQVDEDLAMWIEDKQGNRKQVLKKPVGGRPVTLYSKKDVEKIEQKGVSPFERLKVWVEFQVKRPTRGY